MIDKLWSVVCQVKSWRPIGWAWGARWSDLTRLASRTLSLSVSTASMELQVAATPEVGSSEKAPVWSVRTLRSQLLTMDRGEHRRDIEKRNISNANSTIPLKRIQNISSVTKVDIPIKVYTTKTLMDSINCKGQSENLNHFNNTCVQRSFQMIVQLCCRRDNQMFESKKNLPALHLLHKIFAWTLFSFGKEAIYIYFIKIRYLLELVKARNYSFLRL